MGPSFLVAFPRPRSYELWPSASKLRALVPSSLAPSFRSGALEAMSFALQCCPQLCPQPSSRGSPGFEVTSIASSLAPSFAPSLRVEVPPASKLRALPPSVAYVAYVAPQSFAPQLWPPSGVSPGLEVTSVAYVPACGLPGYELEIYFWGRRQCVIFACALIHLDLQLQICGGRTLQYNCPHAHPLATCTAVAEGVGGKARGASCARNSHVYTLRQRNC